MSISPDPQLPGGSPAFALPVGATFGAYAIKAVLGAGGMGEVYRAFDGRLGREIALKVIRRIATDDDSALDRLLREATLASALNHPNIVTIYETGVVQSNRYIAMELVEGSTLRTLASQGLPLRASSVSRDRWPKRWPSRMRRRSSIATSSQTT